MAAVRRCPTRGAISTTRFLCKCFTLLVFVGAVQDQGCPCLSQPNITRHQPCRRSCSEIMWDFFLFFSVEIALAPKVWIRPGHAQAFVYTHKASQGVFFLRKTMILMGAGDGGSEATWGNAVPVLKWGRGAVDALLGPGP